MKLTEIKETIQSIIKERDEIALTYLEVIPSKYWQYFAARTKYLLDLSGESLKDIRYHTYHITSDLYQRYAFGNSDILLQTGALDWRSWMWLSEPENGIGFDYRLNSRTYKISTDLINTNRFLRLMFGNGVLDFLDPQKVSEIVEIGAGYGGLAYQLIKWIGDRAKTLRTTFPLRYYIIDLPEILLFSAVYFAVNMSDARIYIYNPNKSMPENFNDYDVVLIPNYKINLINRKMNIIKRLTNVKLMINIASFQEMTYQQVREYLDFAQTVLADDGCLFSWNMDRNPANAEPELDVSKLLLSYFDAIPVSLPAPAKKKDTLQEYTARILRAAALAVKLMPPAPEPFYPVQNYKGYVCRKFVKGE